MERVILTICALIHAISAFPPSHIKGIQINNKGREGLWIEMTDEDSFILPPGQTASVLLEDKWAGKIFARSQDCQHKKCNSPYTVAEITFGGDTKVDKYRVSVVDGYNKAIKIQPTGERNFCKIASCKINLKQDCPETYQMKNEEGTDVIACRSLPEVFQKLCPQAAVRGDEKETFSCGRSDTYSVSIG